MKKYILGLLLLLSSYCFGSDGYQMDMFASGINKEGQPLAGGRVYFYEVGSSTTANVYSDVECTSALVQPVTLSSSGTYEIYGKNTYKVVIKDADDVVFDTFDTFKYTHVQDVVAQSLTPVTVDSSDAFNTLLSTITTANSNLLINTDILVTSLITVPANVTLWFGAGGRFTYQAPLGRMIVNGGIVSEYGRVIFASFPYTQLTIKAGVVPIYYSDQGNLGGVSAARDTLYVRSNLLVTGNLTLDKGIYSDGGTITINSSVVVTSSLSVNGTLSVTGAMVLNPVAYPPTPIVGSRFAMFTPNTVNNLLTLRRYAIASANAYHTLMRIVSSPKVGNSLPAEATLALCVGDGNSDLDLENQDLEVVDIYNNKYYIGQAANGLSTGGNTYDVSQTEPTELNYATYDKYVMGVLSEVQETRDKQQWGMRYFMNDSSDNGGQTAKCKPFIIDMIDSTTRREIPYTSLAQYDTPIVVTVGSDYLGWLYAGVTCNAKPDDTVEAGPYEVDSVSDNGDGTFDVTFVEWAPLLGINLGSGVLRVDKPALGAWRMLMIEPKTFTSPTSNNVIKLFGKTRVIADTALNDVLQVDVNNKSVAINSDGDPDWNLIVSGNTTSGTFKVQGKSDGDGINAKFEMHALGTDHIGGWDLLNTGQFNLNYKFSSVWMQPIKIKGGYGAVDIHGATFDGNNGFVGIGMPDMYTGTVTANLVVRGNNPEIWLQDASASEDYATLRMGTGDGGFELWNMYDSNNYQLIEALNPSENFFHAPMALGETIFYDSTTGLSGGVLFKNNLAESYGYHMGWEEYYYNFMLFGNRMNSGGRRAGGLMLDGDLYVSSNIGTTNAKIVFNPPSTGVSVLISSDPSNYGLSLIARSITLNALSNTGYQGVNINSFAEIYGYLNMRGAFNSIYFADSDTGAVSSRTQYTYIDPSSTGGFRFYEHIPTSTEQLCTINAGLANINRATNVERNYSYTGVATRNISAETGIVFIQSSGQYPDTIQTISDGIDGQILYLLLNNSNPAILLTNTLGNIAQACVIQPGGGLTLIYRLSDAKWYPLTGVKI